MAVIKAKNYLKEFNEVQIAYLTGWNMSNQPNLKDLMNFITSVMQSDPPVLSAHERNSMFKSDAGMPINPQDNP